MRAEPDLLVTKRVNSAFHGDPDLERWLTDKGIEGIVVCGITTNHCCETTARVGANLGFEMSFAIDATHTFDLDDHEGGTIAADELARVTAANLDPEFGRVLTHRRRNRRTQRNWVNPMITWIAGSAGELIKRPAATA